MPQQEIPLKRKMGDPNRPGNYVWEEGSAGVRCKERSVIRVQRGIEQFLNPRHINFRILDEGMIAMNENGGSREEKKQ